MVEVKNVFHLDRIRYGLYSLPFLWGFCLDFLTGVTVILSMTYLSLWSLMFVCFPLFFWRLEGSSSWKQAFFRGWSFGLGIFLFGSFGVSHALTISIEAGWLLYLTVLGFFCMLAFFACVTACLSMIWFWFSRRVSQCHAILLFAVLFTLGCWVQGEILLHPFNLYGILSLGWLPLAQSISLWGIYGQTFFILCIALIPVWFLEKRSTALAVCILFLCMIGYGYWKLLIKMPLSENEVMPTIRIIHTTVPPADKLHRINKRRRLNQLLSLTRRPSYEDIQIFIWPEVSVFNIQNYHLFLRARIHEILSNDAVLMLGMVRIDKKSSNNDNVYNSLFVFDNQGKVIDTYDKYRLMPFGEFIPSSLVSLLALLGLDVDKNVLISPSFTVGSGNKTVSLPYGLPSFLPLICYEIFSSRYPHAYSRPATLITITNDGWVKDSRILKYLLSNARIRAIEQGLPLLRSTNLGISAAIDANGKIIQSISDDKEGGIIDVMLPPSYKSTLFVHFGHTPFFLCLIILVLYVLQSVRFKK